MAAPLPNKVSLSKIKSKLLRPALTSHYICNFQPPRSGFFSGRSVNTTPTKLYDRLSLACSDASLPGSTIATHDITNDFTGVSEKHAYRRLYDDRADFTFYVDAEEYYALKFFETWIGYVVNENYGNNPARRNYNYRVNYSKDYTVDSLSISKFERSYGTNEKGGNSILRYNFVKAFPISINSIPVSYESSQLLKCTVSFTYSRYWIEGLSLQGNSASSGDSENFGEPGLTYSSTTPRSPFDITPEQQAIINKTFTENFNFNNYSPGTFTNTNFENNNEILWDSGFTMSMRDEPLW